MTIRCRAVIGAPRGEGNTNLKGENKVGFRGRVKVAELGISDGRDVYSLVMGCALLIGFEL
jgi:hypothetical protein